jgi:hypothetical protein
MVALQSRLVASEGVSGGQPECSGRLPYLKLLLHEVEGWEPILRPYPFLKICTVYLAVIISRGAVFLVTQPIEIILIPYITLSYVYNA